MSQEKVKMALEEIQKDCYPPKNSTNAPLSSGFSLITDLGLLPACTMTPSGKLSMKIMIDSLKDKVSPTNGKNALLETVSTAVESKASSSSSSSEESAVKKQNTENSGTGGLFSGLKGLLKGKDKDGKDEEGKNEEGKNKEGKGKEGENKEGKGKEDKNKEEMKSVKGLDNLFKDKLNEKWFKEQKKYFVEENNNIQLLEGFFNNGEKKGKDVKIDDSILKKYIYLYLTSFYSKIDDHVNKVNVIEHIVAYLLDEIKPNATVGGTESPVVTPKASTPLNASTPKSSNSNPANASSSNSNPTKASNPAKDSSKINQSVFDNLLKKLEMYLYTSEELSQFNIKKGVKSKIDKATQDKVIGGNKKQIGSAPSIKDVADGMASSVHSAPSIGDKFKSLKNSAKNLLINDSKFWTYDSSDKGRILLIDIEEKSKLNIEKYKDIDNIDIANKIIKYLGDEIDKLDPIINDKGLKDIALKIRYNQNIKKNIEFNTPKQAKKDDIPISKDPIIKDKNNLIKDDEKKQILKLILQGIKFMFELSLKGPGRPKQEEHKLKDFVDDFVTKSSDILIGSTPLFKKGENDKTTHIKLDDGELKKAFECLVTEIITPEDKKKKDFPLKDISKNIKDKEKGEYIIYNISKSGIASTLKGSCSITIPPSMNEIEFKKQIIEYKIPPNIYTKEQETFNNSNKDKVGDTNLIHKMIEKMRVLATNPTNALKDLKSSSASVSKAKPISDAAAAAAAAVKLTKRGGKNITNKEYTFILGRKRILNKIGRSYYVKYNSINIKLTEARAIEKNMLKTKILSKRSKKIHHFI